MKNNIFFLLTFIATTAFSQEFQAKVTVNTSRVNTSVDKKIFTTLQNQLTNFINNRKWTSETYKPTEKIDVNFVLNIESIIETNVYKAQLLIQSARPVFSSTYQAALINFQDADVAFKYIEYQPIEFNENRVAGSDAFAANLTAIFAYYANVILGLNYDSYSPKGGDKYFQKAQYIVNNAPEANSLSGWKAFDGLRNRFWLAENLTNARNNILHSVIYGYYRSGFDKMVTNQKEAIPAFVQALTQLKTFNQENPNSMFVQFFMQNKIAELIGIFKLGGNDDKVKALEILSNLDPSNASKYAEELR
ncbi:MAG: DUF4835 family protein [Chitinophagaceae bacterium]